MWVRSWKSCLHFWDGDPEHDQSEEREVSSSGDTAEYQLCRCTGLTAILTDSTVCSFRTGLRGTDSADECPHQCRGVPDDFGDWNLYGTEIEKDTDQRVISPADFFVT